MRSLMLWIICLIGSACQPAHSSPPPSPSGKTDASAYNDVLDAACENLKKLECAEGVDPNCVAVMTHVQATRLTELHPACLAESVTKAAARACGSVACP